MFLGAMVRGRPDAETGHYLLRGSGGFALGLILYQYRLIHDRDRARCFKAFLHNNWVGATIFAGIALDYLADTQDSQTVARMKYKDLRDFIAQLEHQGELKRITVEIDPRLEMTEICDRVLKAGGPAILFEKPKGHTIPVLGNLFGTPRRVAMGMGQDSVEALREVGKLLAYLKEPEPPKGLRDAWEKLPVLKQVLNMAPKELSRAPCQEIVWEGKDVDLGGCRSRPAGRAMSAR